MGARQRQVLASAVDMVIQRLEERRMLSATLDEGAWTIEVEDDRNHVISVDISPTNPSRLKLTMDGKVVGTASIDNVEYVEIQGGAGNDKISFNVASADLWVDVYGGDGNDTIIGGGGDDDLSGEGGDDSIIAGAGDDVIYGDEGKDTIDGGKGDDEIYSDEGDDKIDGGGGDDTIYAGSGDDDISGEEGDDDIWGGWGDDDIDGDGGEDDIYGGRGADDLDGGDGGDDLSGGSGADELIGAAGDDDLDGRTGRDTLAGGLGEDSLDGGLGADQEHGGWDDDWIYGGWGQDTIWGGEGADWLVGGASRDIVYSESGDKVKWGRWDLSRNDQLVNPLHKVQDTSELKNWLIDQAVKQYQWLLEGGSVWYGGGWCCIRLVATTVNDATRARISAATLSSSSSSAPDSVPDHSDTNTQEQGVDEADLIETDGQYLYSITGGRLVIISALPAEETQVVSTTAIEGSPSGIYLDGDRLVVLSDVTPPRFAMGIMYADWAYQRYQPQSKVTVFDVSDRANPKVMEETTLDGTIDSSRQIDGRLYLVVNNSLDLPRPQWMRVDSTAQPDPADDDDGTILVSSATYRYENEAEYRARLAAMSLEDLLPKYKTKVPGADGQVVETSGSLADQGQMYLPDDDVHRSMNMSSVVLINLDDDQPGPTAVTNIVGMNGQTYASLENIYVTTQVRETPMGDWQGETRTDIYKFSLGENSVDLEATGEVPGWVLNSFSMDEEGDQFRIATTNSEVTSSNNLLVLTQHGEKLQIVGGITGLAFKERLYSARFVGDKAYLVTFPVPVLRRGGPVPMDPLFTVDLSDPSQPTVMGELVIPGYSTYLHPLDDGHLLAIGRDGNDVQLSLFDVSDMSDPRRVDVFTITGGWATWSAAEDDPHAFSYFPQQHILALPVEDWSPLWGRPSNNRTILLNVDPKKGFTQVGSIDQRGTEKRNVRIGDYLYAFSSNELKVVALDNPGQVVTSLDFAPAPPDFADIISL